MRSSATRAATFLAGLVLAGVAAYALFVLSDPIDAFRNSGPFTGTVIDAETKKPIKGAFVLASWQGSIVVHGGGCAGHAIARTDDDGRFYIPWQGMNIKWFLQSIGNSNALLGQSARSPEAAQASVWLGLAVVGASSQGISAV